MSGTRDHLLRYFAKKWARYAAGLLLVLAASYFAASVPRLLGAAIDRLREGAPEADILAAAGRIAAAAFLAFALRFVWRYLVFGFTRGAETYVRARLFWHLESLSSDFYVRHSTGDIITRAISDLLAIRRMFGFGFVAVVDAAAIFAVVGASMFANAGAAMSLAALLPVPFLAFFIARIRRALRERQYEIREAASALAAKAQENLTGIRVIKTYAQEDSETENFAALSRARWDKEMRMARLSASISPLVQLAFAAVFAAFIYFGGRMVASGAMSVGDFAAFNGYILLISNPVANIGRVAEIWQTGLSSIDRLDGIFKTAPSVTDDFAEEGAEVTEGRIRLDGLRFAYPRARLDTKEDFGAPPAVLDGLSFELAPGEVLAVTGPVGCGKTTLASVLLRLWNVPQGMVYIDGNDINSLPVRKLRAAIGYVPQDGFLFSESIMDNIRFHDDAVTEEGAREAARAVALHDTIMSFPDGYATVVGERGVTLSGGQKQRVSIARALARRPKILVLDDCLSAVDAQTEAEIIAGLRVCMRGATGIVITHRAAACRLADRILVMGGDGRAAEIGTYAELVARRGEFFRIASMQAGEGGGLAP